MTKTDIEIIYLEDALDFLGQENIGEKVRYLCVAVFRPWEVAGSQYDNAGLYNFQGSMSEAETKGYIKFLVSTLSLIKIIL
jgi:hypothetical protein